MRGHDDNRQLGILVIESIQQRQTVHARHAYIGNKDVGWFAIDGFQQMFAALETAGRNAVLLQRFFQYPAQRLIVIDNPGCQFGRAHVTPTPWRSAECG